MTVAIYERVWAADANGGNGGWVWRKLYGGFRSVPAATAHPAYAGPAFHAIWPEDGSKPPADPA